MSAMTYRAAWQVLDYDMTVQQLRQEALAVHLPDLLYDAHVQQTGEPVWSIEDGKELGEDPGMYLVANVPVAVWTDPVLSRNRRASLPGEIR
jgi:hypothetical protein